MFGQQQDDPSLLDQQSEIRMRGPNSLAKLFLRVLQAQLPERERLYLARVQPQVFRDLDIKMHTVAIECPVVRLFGEH